MENNTALKPRLHWIDVLKGVGIILIMMGHINSEPNPCRGFIRYLWRFSLPFPALFFQPLK